MTTVWLAYNGEYENRGVFAVFASEELARRYSDDVQEIDVFDRPVRTVRRFSRWIEIREGVARDHFPKRVSLEWPEWVGPDFDKPVERADVHHYAANPPHSPAHTWVIVEGASEEQVDAEVLRLTAANGATYESGFAVGWGGWENRYEATEALPYGR